MQEIDSSGDHQQEMPQGGDFPQYGGGDQGGLTERYVPQDTGQEAAGSAETLPELYDITKDPDFAGMFDQQTHPMVWDEATGDYGPPGPDGKPIDFLTEFTNDHDI
jgi:hypothetical protein